MRWGGDLGGWCFVLSNIIHVVHGGSMAEIREIR
jgi:hypothetical protein